jgi:hypothetical protein
MDDIATLERARAILVRAQTYVTDTVPVLSALEHARQAAIRDDNNDNVREWNEAYACAISATARAVDPTSGPLADVTGYLIVAEYDDSAPSKLAVLKLLDHVIAALDAQLAQA